MERGFAQMGTGRALIALRRAGEVVEALDRARTTFQRLCALAPLGRADDLMARATALSS